MMDVSWRDIISDFELQGGAGSQNFRIMDKKSWVSVEEEMSDEHLNQEVSMPMILVLLVGLGVYVWFQYSGGVTLEPELVPEMEELMVISGCEKTYNGTALSCNVTAKADIPARAFVSVFYDKDKVKLGQLSFPSYRLSVGEKSKEEFASNQNFGEIDSVLVFYAIN